MPTSIELFAGAGGMALGMSQAGFRHARLVEWDKRACAVLRANAIRTPSLWAEGLIREMDVRVWLKEVEDEIEDLGDIAMLAGGPPCQPFSLGGVHAGYEDKRNMFPAAVDALRLLRPRLAVFENVPGLLRSSFRPYYDYIADQVANPGIRPRTSDEAWEVHARRVQNTVEREYEVYVETINAADLGVPQARKRVFLIAIRADQPDADRWPGVQLSHSEDALLQAQWISGSYWEEHELRRPRVPERLRPRLGRLARELDCGDGRWRTVRDALVGLPTPREGVESAGVMNHWGIPGARSYPGHTGSPIDWPSKTLKAGVHGVCGGEAMIRFPDDALRYMTIREAARMQGFSDSYEIPGARSAAMWTIGNAVAVDVAAAIGTQLRRHVGMIESSASRLDDPRAGACLTGD